MKLNQVIALVQGKKARATRVLTDVYKGWNTIALSGITKTYSPSDEEGEKFPDEKKEVQMRVGEVIDKLKVRLADYYNIVATQEGANQHACADVKIGDNTLLSQVPITVLLFFEKQIVDLLTFTKSLPILPTEKVWTFDKTKDCYVTTAEETTKTQKRPEVIVKYQATKEHPAQTEMFSVDKTVGHWKTVHMSGALPATEREEFIERLEKLQDAVKSAREEANSSEVSNVSDYGKVLLDYIF
jgi:hypothetical protein